MSQMLPEQGAPIGPPSDQGAPPDAGGGLPPELVAAIQGAGQGGPPGGDPTAGLPPELLDMLSGGGGGPGGPPGANPAGAAGGKPGIDDPNYKILVSMLARIAAQEPDHADAAALLKLVGQLKQLIGGREDQGIQAMGGNPTQMRGLARAYGG